ncbi:pyridoxamine 5'-phosphate oxidase [Trichothermofontia sichuanensis B231]|uniref:pyridoxamine 5'-phosphate oxidase n=1 Tax=Trichothermofontia sichuanensis TaxID=3045816 RepID=UPI0022463F20|nr:pyridoxamine 5'-phosphate oxidase [Trichothermofontia sichuanensis B231]
MLTAEAIAQLRQEYSQQVLRETDVAADPIEQFAAWFQQAVAAQVPQPNAMTLATVSPAGLPSARIVLLNGLDERGFIFYTHYRSRKGQELAANPHAALVFLWHELERQVRIEGQVERVTAAISDAYFQSRPRGSQLGAWTSPQSQPIASREVLEAQFQVVSQQYADRPVPRPPDWGGYRVCPHTIEFWQGRPNRLHDRLRYRQGDHQTWHLERLAP